MFSGIDFLLKRTMSSFFDAIKNLLTAYHTDKSSTGKIIEPLMLKADRAGSAFFMEKW